MRDLLHDQNYNFVNKIYKSEKEYINIYVY